MSPRRLDDGSVHGQSHSFKNGCYLLVAEIGENLRRVEVGWVEMGITPKAWAAYRVATISGLWTGSVDAEAGTARAEWKDHPLKGEWSGHRECHVGGDFLLIYKADDAAANGGIVVFVRAGTHADLFGE